MRLAGSAEAANSNSPSGTSSNTPPGHSWREKRRESWPKMVSRSSGIMAQTRDAGPPVVSSDLLMESHCMYEEMKAVASRAEAVLIEGMGTAGAGSETGLVDIEIQMDGIART